ncbi:hypothetical protein XELAEV_18035795mg [Xenopus laevis]|uniref:Uncharacterized protein n=1 Tax=Xenopus laevis TaxID=8355 RepID=A0A974HCG5_XENLA|nr:hypothetical protein XELAEV_18035795mg [Xenopus laevis]
MPGSKKKNPKKAERVRGTVETGCKYTETVHLNNKLVTDITVVLLAFWKLPLKLFCLCVFVEHFHYRWICSMYFPIV